VGTSNDKRESRDHLTEANRLNQQGRLDPDAYFNGDLN